MTSSPPSPFPFQDRSIIPEIFITTPQQQSTPLYPEDSENLIMSSPPASLSSFRTNESTTTTFIISNEPQINPSMRMMEMKPEGEGGMNLRGGGKGKKSAKGKKQEEDDEDDDGGCCCRCCAWCMGCRICCGCFGM